MKNYYLIIICLISIIMVGCTTVPSLRVSQPWIRTLKSSETINPTKHVKIEVTGTTSPLIGNELLTSEKLSTSLSYLIKRRGFTIDNTEYDYVIKLSYKTDRSDKMNFSSDVSSMNSQAFAMSTGSGTGITLGLGVSIARAVGMLVSQSSTIASQTAEQSVSYIHTIAIEISSKAGLILWKGESTWDSEELNLINRIIPALQLMLSYLPSDKTVRPEIAEVKETHVLNYYRLECKDVWFTCPALPYRILFNSEVSTGGMNLPTKISIPQGILNPNALAAYVDLVQTAEYALPGGDEIDWKDPTRVSLWKNVSLGGQYFLGPQKTPVSILIDMEGKSDGYYIQECKIATNEEYSDFINKMNHWREVLSNYYDVYKQ